MKRLRQIALAFPVAAAHHQEIFQGIIQYTRERGVWAFTGSPETFTMSVTDLKGWPGDGVIAEVNSQSEAAAAKRLRLPLVNISGALKNSGLPTVTNDHRLIGRLAAEHLLDRGLRRFAYYGLSSMWYAAERGRGFVDRVKAAGASCEIWEALSSVDRRAGWSDWLTELQHWLGRMEKPIGIMAAHDGRARIVVDACRQLGLHVPHDVAIVGTNNDAIACEYSDPQLSSISRNGERIGYEAAACLDRLMAGGKVSPMVIVISPGRVIARASTDTVATSNPDINAVVHFIREHYTKPITVDDVLRDVVVSRRWLEHRFKQHFGRTLHQYISEQRVEKAKDLLGSAEKMKLGQIALQCGFTETRHFRAVFRRIVGMSPADYRRLHASGEGA